MSTANYNVWIDWDKDGGLTLSHFEETTEGWEGFGSTPPDVSVDTTRAYTGESSLLTSWIAYNPFQFDVSGKGFDQGRFGVYTLSNSTESFKFDTAGVGFDQGRFGFADIGDPTINAPEVRKVLTGLRVGVQYTLSAFVWVPTGDVAVKLGVVDQTGYSSVSSTNDAWEKLTLTFTTTSTTHTLQLIPNANPSSGDFVWMDRVQLIAPGEDVTNRVYTSTDINFQYGRDSARSLAEVRPGTCDLELNNQSFDYSPENTGSPLYGFIGPGKPITVVATFQNKEWPLFQGYLEEYNLSPGVGSGSSKSSANRSTSDSPRSVTITSVDLLGQLSQTKVSTSLYEGVRTGDAINVILDCVGWRSDSRRIDPGGSIIAYWWEENITALDAINRLVASEGAPAVIFVDGVGNLVFWDRHHRLLREDSTTVQQSFNGGDPILGDAEPSFSYPYVFEAGWKELYNDVDLTVDHRFPARAVSNIFESDTTIVLSPNQSVDIEVKSSDPFTGAIVPVAGTDYTLLEGNITLSLSRTSGQSLKIHVQAGNSNTVIEKLAVRGILVPVAVSYKVTGQDVDSIAKYGLRTYPNEMPWSSLNDAKAIVETLLGTRSDRLPLVFITLNNGAPERLTEILSRQMSDRVHIKEPETFTDHDYFLERVDHTINASGLYHEATFGCEKVRDQIDNVFTFDDATRGFDRGYFGIRGIDSSENIFTLDSSHLGSGLLGY